MLFGKKEVFMTNQMEQYIKAKQALTQTGIPYDLKTVNTGSQSRSGRNTMGRILGNTELELFYYLYVKKADEERARYTIREAFRQ